MAKAARLAVLAATLLLVSPMAWAFENEPAGFRGIAWGTPMDVVRAKTNTWFNRNVAPGIDEYRSRSDLTMNGVPLTYNFYQFYRGRFSTGIMEAESAYCASMLETLIARFGEPDKKIARTRFVWHGKITTIVYICSRAHDMCRVGLESATLVAEQEKDLADSARKHPDF